jgi:hypothetical protein
VDGQKSAVSRQTEGFNRVPGRKHARDVARYRFFGGRMIGSRMPPSDVLAHATSSRNGLAIETWVSTLHLMHVYEVRLRKDKSGVDLISAALPFGRLWYTEIPHVIGYAKFFSRSHDAVIRVRDTAGNVIETHEHAGEFKSRECTP